MDTERKKILIVEDDPDERMAMHLRMKACGYETFFAIDGITSMVEAQKHRPDLILLDIRMPAGDGYTVMDRLRHIPELAVIPVIVISVGESLEHKQRALEAGAKMFFQKPPHIRELLTGVRRWLGQTPIEPAVYDL
jgi:DNA-binding response OmpR family regulator